MLEITNVNTNVNSDSCFVKLKSRGLIHIEGEERKDLLQNIITNDLAFLSPDTALYSCLLSPQGKFLHDFFITEIGETLLLECEGGERAKDLYRRLKMYALRRKITFSVDEHIDVYAVFSDAKPAPHAYKDPRHPDMGWRVHGEHPDNIPESPFETWDKHRISLCIPDGSRDLEIERANMLESNLDKLHAVSFTKGCFVGQELTARMNYRGLSKKHLYAVKINDDTLQSGDDIKIEGKLTGTLRSRCGDIGLAQIKDAMLDNLHHNTAISLL